MKSANRLDYAWLAGILDGEGCFSVDKSCIKISCGMTDLDVIERLQQVVGSGSVLTREKAPPRKTLYVWTLCSRKEVLDVLCAIAPFMSNRRRTRISKMADAAIDMQSRATVRLATQLNRVMCKNNHNMDKCGFYWRGNSKTCRQCHRDRTNRSRSKVSGGR